MPESRADMPLHRLAAPILAENLVRTTLLAVDQLMLYSFAASAAAAMAAASQLAFFLQLLYAMPALGASILIAHDLGAGRKAEAERHALGGLGLGALLAILVSLAYVLLAGPVLGLFRLEEEVFSRAATFLRIYGGASFFMAMNIGQAATLRSWGQPRDAMAANIAALVTTVLGNWLALFGPFGLPLTGMAGVAWSNVAGQVVAFFAMGVFLRARGIRLRLRDLPGLSGKVTRGILAMGLPSVGENISYNLSQIVIVSIIAGMGTAALAAYGLVVAISRYIFIFGVSVGSAGQVKVGWLAGAGRGREALPGVQRWFLAGAAVSLGLAIAVNLLKPLFLPLFTRDPAISSLASSVLLVGLLLEPGRCLNTIVIPGLKGAGDVHFPVLVGVLFMWGVSVAGARLLGVGLGMGLVGVWLAMSADEWSRGLVMLWRWRSGRWLRNGSPS
jgi:putative MATE family efflux protein